MIIKIVPETEAEKAKHKEIEFSGVREFFLVGNRRDEDGYVVDFHEWEGGYRYLLSSLHWFYKIIDDERSGGATAKTSMKMPQMIKRGEVNRPNIQILNPQPFPVAGIDPNEPNRGGDAFQEVDGEIDGEEEANPEEAFPEDDDKKVTKFPFAAQAAKKFPQPPRPLNRNLPSKEELDEVTKKVGKKYGRGEDQANPDE